MGTHKRRIAKCLAMLDADGQESKTALTQLFKFIKADEGQFSDYFAFNLLVGYFLPPPVTDREELDAYRENFENYRSNLIELRKSLTDKESEASQLTTQVSALSGNKEVLEDKVYRLECLLREQEKLEPILHPRDGAAKQKKATSAASKIKRKKREPDDNPFPKSLLPKDGNDLDWGDRYPEWKANIRIINQGDDEAKRCLANWLLELKGEGYKIVDVLGSKDHVQTQREYVEIWDSFGAWHVAIEALLNDEIDIDYKIRTLDEKLIDLERDRDILNNEIASLKCQIDFYSKKIKPVSASTSANPSASSAPQSGPSVSPVPGESAGGAASASGPAATQSTKPTQKPASSNTSSSSGATASPSPAPSSGASAAHGPTVTASPSSGPSANSGPVNASPSNTASGAAATANSQSSPPSPSFVPPANVVMPPRTQPLVTSTQFKIAAGVLLAIGMMLSIRTAWNSAAEWIGQHRDTADVARAEVTHPSATPSAQTSNQSSEQMSSVQATDPVLSQEMYAHSDKVRVWAKLIRNKPASLIKTLGRGEKVNIEGAQKQLASLSKSKWVRISLTDGQAGYVLTKELSADMPPVIEPRLVEQFQGERQPQPKQPELEDNGQDNSSNPVMKLKVKYAMWIRAKALGSPISWDDYDRYYDISFACGQCKKELFRKGGVPAEQPQVLVVEQREEELDDAYVVRIDLSYLPEQAERGDPQPIENRTVPSATRPTFESNSRRGNSHGSGGYTTQDEPFGFNNK